MLKRKKLSRSFNFITNEEFFLLIIVAVTYVSFSVVYILIPQSDSSIWNTENTENTGEALLNSLNELIPETLTTTDFEKEETSPEDEKFAHYSSPGRNEDYLSKNKTSIFNVPIVSQETKYIYLVNREQNEVEPFSKLIDEEWFRISE